MRFLRSSLLAFATVSVLFLAACDSNGSDPGVAGRYVTTEFILRTDTATLDALALGASIEMTLESGGTVRDGLLFVPDTLTTGQDFEGDTEIEFAGTWSRPTDGTLTFEHDADTFIRDTEWTYDDGTIQAQTDELTVTLVRQDT